MSKLNVLTEQIEFDFYVIDTIRIKIENLKREKEGMLRLISEFERNRLSLQERKDFAELCLDWELNKARLEFIYARIDLYNRYLAEKILTKDDVEIDESSIKVGDNKICFN